MTIHNRPDQKRDDAFEKAFSEHHKWDWIQELSHSDAIDLLSRCWLEYTKPGLSGPIGWRHQNTVDVLTDAADKICKIYAENNVERYLEDEENF